MKKTIFIIVTLIALLTSSSINANSFNEEIIKNEIITAKAETERHIWIGTTTGVWQINKKNNKVVKYTMSNSQLPSDNITGICVGKYEQVFIATDNGLYHYDNYAFLVINTDNSGLPSNKITSMVSDNSFTIWIGTADMGLVKMYNGRYKTYNTTNSDIASNAIKSIEKEADGNLKINCESLVVNSSNR